jgi:type II secretory pathway pseudopilin PulG
MIGIGVLLEIGKDFIKWIGARGLVVLGVVAMLALGSFLSYQAGKKDARAECQTAALQSKIATMETDIKNSRIAEADAKARNLIIEEFGKHNEEKINELEDKLAKEPPEAVCRASESDLRWLRGIK